MAYSAIVEMAQSVTLRNRITAAAATQDIIADPVAWTNDHIWDVVTEPGWADDWAYAVDTATPNVNPDTGARTDVISDGKILAAVQANL